MFGLLLDVLTYAQYLFTAIVSIGGAIYLPILGFFALLGVAATFFDCNKKIYGRYFISPGIFFDKQRKLRPYHKLLFYLFSVSLLVNVAALFLRLIDDISV